MPEICIRHDWVNYRFTSQRVAMSNSRVFSSTTACIVLLMILKKPAPRDSSVAERRIIHATGNNKKQECEPLQRRNRR